MSQFELSSIYPLYPLITSTDRAVGEPGLPSASDAVVIALQPDDAKVLFLALGGSFEVESDRPYQFRGAKGLHCYGNAAAALRVLLRAHACDAREDMVKEAA